MHENRLTSTKRFRDRITLNFNEGIADVRLARPEKMNALDGAMFAAFADAIAHLHGLADLRVVVVSGEGSAFCAGLDQATFKAVMAGDNSGAGGLPMDLTARSHGIANLPQQAAMGWRSLAVPVLASISGVAFGGGLQVALGADLRFCDAKARLSLMEICWGLVPDMGGMWLLRDLVRGDILRDLVYSGRIVRAEEAARIGLVTQVCVDPLAHSLSLAQDIAGRSPAAIRAARRLIEYADAADPARMLLAESQEQARLLGSTEQRETASANIERRRPIFKAEDEA